MNPKIIVLDDDPTGSQTVHSCLPQLPVVVFPGNVGGDGALAEASRRLAPSHAQASPAKLAA